MYYGRNKGFPIPLPRLRRGKRAGAATRRAGAITTFREKFLIPFPPFPPFSPGGGAPERTDLFFVSLLMQQVTHCRRKDGKRRRDRTKRSPPSTSGAPRSVKIINGVPGTTSFPGAPATIMASLP